MEIIMELEEVKFGTVTYELSRSFNGTRPVKDLILDKLTKTDLTKHPVDERDYTGL